MEKTKYAIPIELESIERPSNFSVEVLINNLYSQIRDQIGLDLKKIEYSFNRDDYVVSFYSKTKPTEEIIQKINNIPINFPKSASPNKVYHPTVKTGSIYLMKD